MRKSIMTFAVLTVAVMLLTSCAAGDLSIENTNWTIQTVQDKDGRVVLCNEENSALYTTAYVSELSAVADDGGIKFYNAPGGDNYKMKVKKIESSSQETLYEVEYEGETGNAVVSYTKNADGRKVKTLILTVSGYSLTFFEG